jgi:hypothetical protein
MAWSQVAFRKCTEAGLKPIAFGSTSVPAQMINAGDAARNFRAGSTNEIPHSSDRFQKEYETNGEIGLCEWKKILSPGRRKLRTLYLPAAIALDGVHSRVSCTDDRVQGCTIIRRSGQSYTCANLQAETVLHFEFRFH